MTLTAIRTTPLLRTATHARTVLYGETAGTLDLTTATCAQHIVASPENGGRSRVQPLPAGTLADCVVCPLPGATLIGLPVLSFGKGNTEPYIYGGPAKDGWDRLEFGIGIGIGTIIRTAFDRVAPADTPIPTSDPRVTVEKLPRKRDYQDAGPWLLRIEGVDGSRWTAWRTKKEALTDGLRRVAILDWHASRAAQAATPCTICSVPAGEHHPIDNFDHAWTTAPVLATAAL